MSRRPCWLAAMPACLLLGAVGTAGAQVAAQLPDAGRALRESTPAQLPPPAPPASLPLPQQPATLPVKPGGASFILSAVAFNGNTRFSSETLQSLMTDHLGRRATLADLQMLAERVNALYRASDYILTQTTVPAQDVTGGRVEFSVLEGRLGRVRIERIDDVPVRDSLIEAVVADLPRDRPLTQHELERAILMLSDVPGMTVQASLEAGDQAGTYDLIVEAKAAPRHNFSLDLDNQGSRATGEYRIGAMARWNSPFGRGDNLDLRLMNAFGKGLNFGRIAYETPLGGPSLRASVAYAHVQYELGRDFEALDAYGSADVFEVAATYPLLRSRLQNLFAKASLEARQLKDNIGSVALASNKRMWDLGLGLVYERRDRLLGGGYSSASLTVFAGELDLRSPEDLAADQDAFGRHTNGRFARASYSASRLQSLAGSVSAYLALAGQWANKNLASADKIALGGPRAVRAYSSSSGIGDEAQIVNAELRWSVTPDTSLSAFYDIGRARIDRRPVAPGNNHQILKGPGLALYWGAPGGMALRASLAWPKRATGLPAGGTDERSPRAYAQLVKAF